MNITDRKIASDKRSTGILLESKKQLIGEGKMPSLYEMPLSIQFEVTSKCNCFCKHCYNASGKGHCADTVTGDKWVEFCKYLVSKGGIMQATISGGEPLLLGDKLWEMMDVLHEDNTVFNLISNGYFWNKEVLERIMKYRFYWIQISIDSCKAENHDAFRKVQGCWERANRAAYNVALAGIPLRIASTITPKELDKLEDLVKMSINLGASYHVIGEVIPSGRAYQNEDIFLSEAERCFFYEEMERLTRKYSNEIKLFVSGTQKVQLEYVSETAIDGAIIRPDGNIRLDCSCPFVIGNILTDDIAEIWPKKADCWQNPLVKKYIASCNPINGTNTFVNNYQDKDIVI